MCSRSERTETLRPTPAGRWGRPLVFPITGVIQLNPEYLLYNPSFPLLSVLGLRGLFLATTDTSCMVDLEQLRALTTVTDCFMVLIFCTDSTVPPHHLSHLCPKFLLSWFLTLIWIKLDCFCERPGTSVKDVSIHLFCRCLLTKLSVIPSEALKTQWDLDGTKWNPHKRSWQWNKRQQEACF